MKTILIALSMLLAFSVSAQPEWVDRTDINPALIYWKEFLVLSGHPNNDQVEPNFAKPTIDAEYQEVVEAYDGHFRRMAKVRQMTVPCDWGGDMTEGPHLLLPHVAHSRRSAQIARLRVRYHLEKDRPDQAVQDLLTAFTLARHVGQEPFLINALVEIAMNGILVDAIAENFHRFPNDALRDLRTGLEALPNGGSMVAAVSTEKNYMAGWVEKQILAAVESAAGDDAQALRIVQAKMDALGDFKWATLMETLGGMGGVLRLVRETYPVYDEARSLFALPPEESLKAIEAHMMGVEESENPFIKMLFPAMTKSRSKEVGNQVRLAMLDAAIAYKLDGESGFETVNDPFADGPFEMTRVRYKGDDRGFVLTSVFEDEDMNRQAFVETPGERFQLSGKTIGEARK